VLIYHVTRRAWWAAQRAGFKFFMTTLLLGLATTCVTVLATGIDPAGVRAVLLSRLVFACALVKAAGEGVAFLHLRDRQTGELKKAASVLVRDLTGWTAARFALLAIGGVALPAVDLGLAAPSLVVAAASLLFLVMGELCERALFFAASRPPGTAGGVK
jgi:DMSO reductase anchor subunit